MPSLHCECNHLVVEHTDEDGCLYGWGGFSVGCSCPSFTNSDKYDQNYSGSAIAAIRNSFVRGRNTKDSVVISGLCCLAEQNDAELKKIHRDTVRIDHDNKLLAEENDELHKSINAEKFRNESLQEAIQKLMSLGREVAEPAKSWSIVKGTNITITPLTPMAGDIKVAMDDDKLREDLRKALAEIDDLKTEVEFLELKLRAHRDIATASRDEFTATISRIEDLHLNSGRSIPGVPNETFCLACSHTRGDGTWFYRAYPCDTISAMRGK